MNIIQVANYEEMSKHAAQYIIEKVRANPYIKLGLATGSTPKRTYQELVKDHRENGTTYQHVQTINLDEYIGLPKTDPNSYHYFMRRHLFDHLDIPSEQIHMPSGTADDLLKECGRYEQLIKEIGGVDLQLLGIGQNGHIGFNEPGTSFKSRTHIVSLAESTRIANSTFFPSLEEVPTRAITVGISTILDSREILLLASGSAKAHALKRLITERIHEEFPASALKLHSHVTIIADAEALKFV
jgi:glucosamine-6-phosphate deaminase